MLYLFGFFKKNINIYIYIQLKCDGRSVKLFFWPDQRNIINSYVYIYNSSGDFNVTCCLAWWYDTPSNWARALNCQAVLGSPSARCWTPGEGDGERERELAQYHFSITLNPLKDMFQGHCFNTWHASKPAEPWICRRNAHPKPSSDHFWLFPELVQAELLAKLWLVYLWDPIGALGLLLTPVGCCCMVAWFSKDFDPIPRYAFRDRQGICKFPNMGLCSNSLFLIPS